MMEERRKQLLQLKTFSEDIDNELTLILQSLQWDRNYLLQKPALVSCKYDANHKVPPDKQEEHEELCFLKYHGYSKEDQLLPAPLNENSSTLVKLNKEQINKIIKDASNIDPSFRKGVGSVGPAPLSLARLQSVYTPDERRAIHDAVVSAAPSCHDLADLALVSGGGEADGKARVRSRVEVLAELRDMRRRRTKYRVAAKTNNYSHVLRDLIHTQMEHFNEQNTNTQSTQNEGATNKQTDTLSHNIHSKQPYRRNKYDDRGKSDTNKRQGEYRERSDREYESKYRGSRDSSRDDYNDSTYRVRNNRHAHTTADKSYESTSYRYSGRDNRNKSSYYTEHCDREIKVERRDRDHTDRHSDKHDKDYCSKRHRSPSRGTRDTRYEHAIVKQEVMSDDEAGTTSADHSYDSYKHKGTKHSRSETDRYKEVKRETRDGSEKRDKRQDMDKSSHYDRRARGERSHESYSDASASAGDKRTRYYDAPQHRRSKRT